jgi:hypothetical protein
LMQSFKLMAPDAPVSEVSVSDLRHLHQHP